jgi:protein translocase SecG subunit
MLQILLYVLFFFSALLLVLVVLVQEGKGGGLGDAFGGGAAQSFGVRAGGVNKVTFGLFFGMVMFAMMLHWTNPTSGEGSIFNDELNQQPGMIGDPAAGDGSGDGADAPDSGSGQ